MEVERWNRIEELYQAALALPPERRAAFLARACSTDPQLRAEVQSLLDQQADSFLEGAPVSAIKTLRPGVKLSNFEIVELIGQGGMGEVYRARDVRLKREVAIKVLPPSMVRDPDRIARFEREARAAGSLNHPNIVAVYDTGHDGDTYWIASELVAGEPLAGVIRHGPLAPRKAIEIAAQIADGLAAAHTAGIVHRDLKPANIMVARDGRVKILDFGLAKQRRPGAASTTVDLSGDLNGDLTGEGVVMGTAGYMSPEQVRGEEVDHRSDLFSAGVVIYETLTGTRAFSGGSSVEVMHAILTDDPPELPASVPPALAGIVGRCLEKEPHRRFQSAADLAFALQSSSRAMQPARKPKRRARLRGAVAAVASVAVATAGLIWLIRPLPPPHVTGIVAITHDNRPIYQFPPFISDGSRIFFSTNDGSVPAYQVSVNGGESVPLTMQMKDAACLLDINPDRTEFLACRASTNSGCELWTEPILGGSPHRLGNLVTQNDAAAWSPDGLQLVYARDKELHLARRDGTEARKIAALAGQPSFPHWSPDGLRIRFSVSDIGGQPGRIWEVRPDGNGLHSILPRWNPSWRICCGIWTADGKYFVFQANDSIWALRETKGFFERATGQPVRLNTGILGASDPIPSTDGKRLYFLGGSEARNEFLRYDLKSGRFALELAGVSGDMLEFSRNGKWVTYVSLQDGSLFRSAADGSQRLQLTSPPLVAGMPHWSPDGQLIAFSAKQGSNADRIYVVPFDGGAVQQLTNGEGGSWGDVDPSWSPDGASLAFGTLVPNALSVNGPDKATEAAIHIVGLKTKQVSTLPGSEDMWSPRWSPDGRFVAGISGAASRLMLYDIRTRTKTEIFNHGSGCPSWSQDGQFVYFGSMGGWWRVRLRDRKAELVNSLKNISLAGWGWFATAPNNSLITARKADTSGIYALDWEAP